MSARGAPRPIIHIFIHKKKPLKKRGFLGLQVILCQNSETYFKNQRLKFSESFFPFGVSHPLCGRPESRTGCGFKVGQAVDRLLGVCLGITVYVGVPKFVYFF